METKSELIRKLEEQIAALPVGYIVYKTIKGKKQQYASLIDEEKNTQTEKRYGHISGRYVIYRGQTCRHDSGVTYLNVEEYLSFR